MALLFVRNTIQGEQVDVTRLELRKEQSEQFLPHFIPCATATAVRIDEAPQEIQITFDDVPCTL